MPALQTIWLIDDDENEQVLVRLALANANISISLESFSEATAAKRALETLAGDFPGLIICDWKLPGMGGVEFLDWLRGSRFAVIPVVIRSNSSLQQDVNAAYEHGANCYVQKGFDIAGIQRNFRLLLDFWSTMCTPEVAHEKVTARRH